MDLIISCIFVFILGSCVGSFLNVCIWRLPRNESLWWPWSHCVNCNKVLSWYDNIPFISYLALRGKCRFCKKPITFRYFIVEFLTAAVFLMLFMKFGLGLRFLSLCILAGGLIVATFTDFMHFEIPDEITLGGIGAGFLLSLIHPPLIGEISIKAATLTSLLGIAAGGGSIYLTGLLGKAAFKKEAMGFGDVKLMGAIGAFLGWKLVLLTFFMAPFFGSIIGIYLKIKRKQDYIPYGPYLSLAALVAIFLGNEILRFLFLI